MCDIKITFFICPYVNTDKYTLTKNFPKKIKNLKLIFSLVSFESEKGNLALNEDFLRVIKTCELFHCKWPMCVVAVFIE